VRSVRIRGKSIPLVALVGILLASAAAGAYAWQVYFDTMSTVTLTVKKADASVVPVPIDIGYVDSGEDFDGTTSPAVTVEILNAKELVAEFNVADLDSTEIAALASCMVSIGEDLDDDGVLDPEEVWGTIDAISPTPFSVTLAKGTHDVLVLVEGTATYPESDVAIMFTVTVTITTPF